MEIRKLNTLRGIAAFIVLVTHFSDTTNWLGGVLGGRAGQYGVMLFFMLSGFLMSYLYMKREFNKYNIKKYALARVGRVLPLYFLLVILSYLFQVTNIEGLYDVYSLKMLVSHFLFIEGQDILWTIAPEIQFYLIFLVLWYIVTWRQGYLYVLIAATLALLYFTNFPRPNGFVYGFPYDFHLFRSIPYFLLGLILGKHYESLTIPGYLKSGWFVLPLLLVPLMYPEFTPVKTGAHYRMWLYFGPLMIVSLVFFSIVFLVPNKNIIFPIKSATL